MMGAWNAQQIEHGKVAVHRMILGVHGRLPSDQKPRPLTCIGKTDHFHRP